MMTVVDQHSPWLMPSRTLAATTHSQAGASMRMNGTGRPMSQPATRICLRPMRSLIHPANRFASALTIPKLIMNDRIAVREVMKDSCSARSGSTARSSPTMPPTKALITTSSVNCRQFAPVRDGRDRPADSHLGSLAVARRSLLDVAAGCAPLVNALSDDREVAIPTMLEHRQPGGGALSVTAVRGDDAIVRQMQISLR